MRYAFALVFLDIWLDSQVLQGILWQKGRMIDIFKEEFEMRKARMSAEEMIKACEEFANFYDQKRAKLLEEGDDNGQIVIVSSKFRVLHALLNYISDEIEG